MSDNSTVQDRLRQPWLIRRAVYALGGLLAVIAAVAFGVTAETLASWEEAIAPVLSIVLAPILGLAAKKAGPEADDKSTVKDVANAREVGRAEAIREVKGVVERALEASGVKLPEGVLDTGPASSLPVYRGPTSA